MILIRSAGYFVSTLLQNVSAKEEGCASIERLVHFLLDKPLVSSYILYGEQNGEQTKEETDRKTGKDPGCSRRVYPGTRIFAHDPAVGQTGPDRQPVGRIQAHPEPGEKRLPKKSERPDEA